VHFGFVEALSSCSLGESLSAETLEEEVSDGSGASSSVVRLDDFATNTVVLIFRSLPSSSA